ncbi:MAG: dienelactone hydrolase family protein [Anaerolineae bacterium]
MSDMNKERFTMQTYFHNRWERVARQLACDTSNEAAYQAWRSQALAKLRLLVGYNTFLPAPIEPRITEELDFPDYTRQRVEIQTEPDVWMPLYVLIPRQGKQAYPAVVAPHGHGSGGKYSVAGCRELPGIAAQIATYNYDYGVQFARAGLIAFCPDARGFGERQERSSRGDLLASSCRDINAQAYPLGQTITGMWAWDIHRLLDYIATRLDCIPGRVACAGLSGGGLQTLWATALDERIRCAVISGYFYGYKESLLDMCENCWCNYVPGLYEAMDMGDIASLIAPRPLLIETGNRDPLNGASGLANVTSQLAITLKAYNLLQAGEYLVHVIGEGEHRWYGEQAVPWLVSQVNS